VPKESIDFTIPLGELFTDNPLVSVIIPSYNVESTLGDTIDSVLRQTYSNLEIIVVNDCSQDGTARLAEQYAAQDGRIKVIHKERNEDLTLARATGFANSTGYFITFIDADDVFTDDAIEVLLRIYAQTGVDIPMAGYVRTDSEMVPHDPPWPGRPVSDEITVYSRDEIIDAFLGGLDAGWPHNNNPDNAYCKLFKRHLLEGLDWAASDYRVGEDTFFSLLTFARAQSAAVANRIILFYRVLEFSKSREHNWQFKFGREPITALTMVDNLAKLAEASFPPEHYPAIGGLVWRIANIYQDAGDMEMVRGFLNYISETSAQKDETIAELQQQNEKLNQRVQDIQNSTTWKLGRIITAPADRLRR